MKTAMKQAVKKVTLELIYDVVDERAKEIKDEIKQTREDVKSINARIDQLHMRLDQMMHILVEHRK